MYLVWCKFADDIQFSPALSTEQNVQEKMQEKKAKAIKKTAYGGEMNVLDPLFIAKN